MSGGVVVVAEAGTVGIDKTGETALRMCRRLVLVEMQAEGILLAIWTCDTRFASAAFSGIAVSGMSIGHVDVVERGACGVDKSVLFYTSSQAVVSER